MEERLIENVNVVVDCFGRLIVVLDEDLFNELHEEGWPVGKRDEQTRLLWVYRYTLKDPIEVPENPVDLTIVRHFWRDGNYTGSKAYLKSAEKAGSAR